MKDNLLPSAGHTDCTHSEPSFSSMAYAQGHKGFSSPSAHIRTAANPLCDTSLFLWFMLALHSFLKSKRGHFPGPGCPQLSYSHEQPQNNMRRKCCKKSIFCTALRQQKCPVNAKPCRAHLLAQLQEDTALPVRQTHHFTEESVANNL